MKNKSDENVIKFILVVLAVLIIAGAALVVKNALGKGGNTVTDVPSAPIISSEPQKKRGPEDYNAPASIEPEDLPEDLEATVGFEPKQLDMLTDHYALARYELGQGSVVYYYQTAKATNGERFMVICTQMSEDDFLASIPDENVKKENYNGIELTYSNRWLYSVPNDYEISPAIQKGIDENKMEIEYGNTLDEVIKKDCFYWYDGGIKYEIQVRNQNLPYDTLYKIAQSIIDA